MLAVELGSHGYSGGGGYHTGNGWIVTLLNEASVLIASCVFFATVDKKLVEIDDRSALLQPTLYALDEVNERKVRQCCMKPTFQLVTYCALVVHAAHTVKMISTIKLC